MKADGQFESASLTAARLAQVMIDRLVHEEGWRARDAEEAALRKFILLAPEPPDEEEWDDEAPEVDSAHPAEFARPARADDD